MIPKKYPKRTDHATADWTSSWRDGELFQVGSAKAHADYLIEMRAKSPITYFLFYRWWIPTLLHEDERKCLDSYMKCCARVRHRSFWADFSLHHPVLYLLYWLFVFLFQMLVKLLTSPVKVITVLCRIQKTPISKNTIENVLFDDKFVEQDSDVPSNQVRCD